MGLRYICLLFLVLAAGCERGAPQPADKPPEVSVITVHEEEVPIVRELPGRVVPIKAALVKARITGILSQQLYKEGSVVQRGDLLYTIEMSTPQASYDNAQAELERTTSTFQQAKVRKERYEDLVKIDAVSQQDYDDAFFTMEQNAAATRAADAALETAAINLSHTIVTAPINGWIGPTRVTVGALLNELNETELTLIQQLDPIYFDFIEVTASLMQLKHVFKQNISTQGAKIQLILEDGSLYEQEGKVLYSDVTVDQGTGTILARAWIPNPNNVLLPGMFLRGRVELARVRGFLVPQQAVVLGPQGTTFVWVITPEGKAEKRPVRKTYTVGHDWLITEGLKSGEQLVMEGFQMIEPGVEVKAVPYHG